MRRASYAERRRTAPDFFETLGGFWKLPHDGPPLIECVFAFDAPGMFALYRQSQRSQGLPVISAQVREQACSLDPGTTISAPGATDWALAVIASVDVRYRTAIDPAVSPAPTV